MLFSSGIIFAGYYFYVKVLSKEKNPYFIGTIGLFKPDTNSITERIDLIKASMEYLKE